MTPTGEFGLLMKRGWGEGGGRKRRGEGEEERGRGEGKGGRGVKGRYHKTIKIPYPFHRGQHFSELSCSLVSVQPSFNWFMRSLTKHKHKI